ncbi:MAG: hypothetical protein ABL892_00260 [Thiobacillaceae bacterium]
MNKDRFKAEYDSYTSEHLLQLRARGDGLVDDAHAAIEEVLTDRGESVPPRPKLAVDTRAQTQPNGQWIQSLMVGIFFMCIAAFLEQVLKGSGLVGGLFSLIIAAFFLVRWIKDKRLAPELHARKHWSASARMDLPN